MLAWNENELTQSPYWTYDSTTNYGVKTTNGKKIYTKTNNTSAVTDVEIDVSEYDYIAFVSMGWYGKYWLYN